jgi:asparagine synthase (glutamine-hydrolysing)
MCGIVGGFALNGSWPLLKEAIARMGSSLSHRGPDDDGVWFDDHAAIALGFRRLSILELSPAGHQPMESACGRFVIVFNGEIYNHLELRKELGNELPSVGAQANGWRGHSDTETLLCGIARWGVEPTLRKLVGMFAFAVWDRRTRTLTLARDRLGEKPLYYGWQGSIFLFASELKALKAHPSFRGEIDRRSVALLLRQSYIPSPYTIYRGFRKLCPGSYAQVAVDDSAGREPHAQAYWSLADTVEEARSQGFAGSERDATAQLEHCLREAVRGQMVADVPLGAMLSGGVDSSAVVALMQTQSTQPIRTFTIGFHEEAYDEARHAKAVAQHLGTDHTELYVTPQQAMEVIPRLSTIYDEPFSDPSQIPTYLVAQLARTKVTVALTGDAGDELFGGYSRYLLADRWSNRLGYLPRALRTVFARRLLSVAPQQWNRFAGNFAPLIPKRYRNWDFGDKLHKLACILDAKSDESFYHVFLYHWHGPQQVVLHMQEPPMTATGLPIPEFEQAMERRMYLDMASYLPDDILVKVDRAAMANSLETRVPFLDHRVVKFAWQLPLSMKVRDGGGKWILRQVLYKYVPKELIDRPKMGFGVPIDSWLRGPLRDWAEALIDESRLRREGYLNPIPVQEKWQEHLSGRRNWQYHLWDVLMFQAWLESESRGRASN